MKIVKNSVLALALIVPFGVCKLLAGGGSISGGSATWSGLTGFPSACSAGTAVTTLAASPTCTQFALPGANTDITSLASGLKIGGASGATFAYAGELTINSPNGEIIEINNGNATGKTYLQTNGGEVVIGAPARIYVRTKAQIDALVPVVGQMILCSNCSVPYNVCIGTGTAAGDWVAMKTGNGCGSNN